MPASRCSVCAGISTSSSAKSKSRSNDFSAPITTTVPCRKSSSRFATIASWSLWLRASSAGVYVIHGASGSGHTLFVEPLETIDLNNELVRLREEEQNEVLRILRELTELLRVHAGEIQASVDAIGSLELLFAKAGFAVDFGCTIPRFSPDSDRRLLLTEARHPLLEDVLRRHKKQVIPISLQLDESQRTLLISGPNTGGKTVSMKTVGLLALMAQAGLPVPAAEAVLSTKCWPTSAICNPSSKASAVFRRTSLTYARCWRP